MYFWLFVPSRFVLYIRCSTPLRGSDYFHFFLFFCWSYSRQDPPPYHWSRPSPSDLARPHHIPWEALRAILRALRPGLDILLGVWVDRALRGIRDSANLCILWLGLKYINIIVWTLVSFALHLYHMDNLWLWLRTSVRCTELLLAYVYGGFIHTTTRQVGRIWLVRLTIGAYGQRLIGT